MDIRDATEHEVPEISALLLAAYDEFLPPRPDEAWADYKADIADAAGRWGSSVQIVAEGGEGLAGCVTFYPPGSHGENDAPDHAWPAQWASIRLLGVHPSARGKGLGRALTEECIHRARALGAPVIALHTTNLMQTAMAMYERMGFKRFPANDFYPVPDFVVMAYKLDL